MTVHKAADKSTKSQVNPTILPCRDRAEGQEKSGPGGAGNTVIPGPNPYEGGAMEQPTHTPPPAYLDGCPECLTRDNQPLTIADSGSKQAPGVVATYRCDCGNTWRTSWAAGWGAA